MIFIMQFFYYSRGNYPRSIAVSLLSRVILKQAVVNVALATRFLGLSPVCNSPFADLVILLNRYTRIGLREILDHRINTDIIPPGFHRYGIFRGGWGIFVNKCPLSPRECSSAGNSFDRIAFETNEMVVRSY